VFQRQVCVVDYDVAFDHEGVCGGSSASPLFTDEERRSAQPCDEGCLEDTTRKRLLLPSATPTIRTDVARTATRGHIEDGVVESQRVFSAGCWPGLGNRFRVRRLAASYGVPGSCWAHLSPPILTERPSCIFCRASSSKLTVAPVLSAKNFRQYRPKHPLIAGLLTGGEDSHNTIRLTEEPEVQLVAQTSRKGEIEARLAMSSSFLIALRLAKHVQSNDEAASPLKRGYGLD